MVTLAASGAMVIREERGETGLRLARNSSLSSKAVSLISVTGIWAEVWSRDMVNWKSIKGS